MTDREKLIKNIMDEIYRLKGQQGIDIIHMRGKKRSRWIEDLVRQFH
jgi:hypothetical protein